MATGTDERFLRQILGQVPIAAVQGERADEPGIGSTTELLEFLSPDHTAPKSLMTSTRTRPAVCDAVVKSCLLLVTCLAKTRIGPALCQTTSSRCLAGQRTGNGWEKRGDGPRRVYYQLTGPDRVSTGQALEAMLRALGYDADVSFA